MVALRPGQAPARAAARFMWNYCQFSSTDFLPYVISHLQVSIHTWSLELNPRAYAGARAKVHPGGEDPGPAGTIVTRISGDCDDLVVRHGTERTLSAWIGQLSAGSRGLEWTLISGSAETGSH